MRNVFNQSQEITIEAISTTIGNYVIGTNDITGFEEGSFLGISGIWITATAKDDVFVKMDVVTSVTISTNA